MKKIGKWIFYLFLASIAISVIGGLISPPEEGKSIENEEVNSSTSKNIDNQADNKPVEHWEYEEIKDEMRGESSYHAINRSTNAVELNFPYNGGTYLNIMLRQSPEHGSDVMFAVNKGQLFCTYNDCYISVKFDDGAVEKYTTNEAEAGASEVLFLANNKSKFVKKLKSAKTVMIEVQFFDHGKEQFKFDVSGLNWDKF